MPFGNSSSSADVNAKRLKAETGIYINGSTLYIDCADDAINSDGDVTIDGGTIRILTNGDGIQGDQRMTIRSGTVSIERAIEGICGKYITFDGGEVNITASDDGINATNNDNPVAALGMEFEILGTGGRIIINDGVIRVTASGDGLDANGSIKQSGDSVYVISKSSGIEVPIDYTGKYNMTGGTLTAFGSGGTLVRLDTTVANTVSLGELLFLFH